MERRKKPRIKKEVKPFYSEGELGVCADCDAYQDFMPHKEVAEGIMIFCKEAGMKVLAQTDIESPLQCPYHK